MAAPSGTTWGSIAGGYGRVGIYVGLSNTNTQTKVTISTWFWSKYSCDDSNNSYYYNNNATSATTKIGSVDISTSVDSGSGWSTSNQVKLGESSYTYDKGKNAVTINCAIKLVNIDRVGATMTHTRSYTIPALASYTVSYNANGGSGAPASQTKYYGINLTLSSTKPTRTGYTFSGWSLTKGGSVYYQAGSTCGKNENITLYAVWKENVLTVNYYSNYATSAFADALNTVGSNKNVKVWTYDFYYDNDYSTYGLANYSSSGGSVYMTRTGYTATKNWGTTTSGGTLVNENTGFSTGQALAKALGKDISSGNASINIYAQWKINTYTITYNSNGGSGSMSSQSIKWNNDFVLSDNSFSREGYKFVGWNACRNDDSKWYVVGQGWLTEDEVFNGGYSKKIYSNQDELTLDASWIKGNETATSFTLYAIWEISGVVYIDNGVALEPYLAYIDNGTSWELYLTYVDDGTTWHIIS